MNAKAEVFKNGMGSMPDKTLCPFCQKTPTWHRCNQEIPDGLDGKCSIPFCTFCIQEHHGDDGLDNMTKCPFHNSSSDLFGNKEKSTQDILSHQMIDAEIKKDNLPSFRAFYQKHTGNDPGKKKMKTLAKGLRNLVK